MSTRRNSDVTQVLLPSIIPSIEQRLNTVSRSLVLIITALSVDGPDIGLGDEDVKDAAYTEAIKAHEELLWLAKLPAGILHLDAPDVDQLEAAEEREETKRRPRKSKGVLPVVLPASPGA